MRILFIHTKYMQYGGEDRAVENEMELLRSKGHDVDVLFFSNTAEQDFLSRLKIGIHTVYSKQSFRETLGKVKAFTPDVVHVHNLFFKASPSVLYALKQLNVPVVATIHNYRLICSNALLLRSGKVCELCVQKVFPLEGIIHRCYRSSAAASFAVTAFAAVHKLLHTWQTKVNVFIVLTEFAKQKISTSSLKLPVEKIEVKPNFTADYFLKGAERENYFLFAGRLSEEKGVWHLIKAFQQMPGERLVIAGAGPLEPLLIEACAAHPNISFTGNLQQQELIRYMQKAKALIFPSIWYEGLPFTIIESFSAGTPVLASNIGSITGLIKHGYNGLLFDAGSHEGIVQCVDQFHKGSSAQDMYQHARDTYLNAYSPAIGYEALMKIYSTAIWQQKKL